MTFQQEQLSLLKLDDGKKEEVALLVSPSEANGTIPRSISLPVTAVKDSPLPPTPSKYADAEEIAYPGIEMSAFPAGSPHHQVNGLSRDSSSASHLADMASVSGSLQCCLRLDLSLSTLKPRRADYVIAVVGAPRVGKSTIIGKAFKAWGLSEPVSLNEEGDTTAPQSKYGRMQSAGSD